GGRDGDARRRSVLVRGLALAGPLPAEAVRRGDDAGAPRRDRAPPAPAAAAWPPGAQVPAAPSQPRARLPAFAALRLDARAVGGAGRRPGGETEAPARLCRGRAAGAGVPLGVRPLQVARRAPLRAGGRRAVGRVGRRAARTAEGAVRVVGRRRRGAA